MASFASSDYAALPPLLVSTTGLETYLSSLSRQLGRDINAMRRDMDSSAREAACAKKAVQDMKRFLTVSAKDSMRAVLEASTPAAQKETDDVFKTLFENADNMTEADLFLGMLALAKKLLSDNVRLRKTLEESTQATRNFLENQEQLKEQLAEANFRIKSFQRDFHELSLWLGTYDGERQATRSFPHAAKGSAAGSGAFFEGHELAAASDAELEGAVSQSPLLLALRRVLLRDMVDRVTHNSEMQAREVGGVVAVLKEDISKRVTPERVVDLLEARPASEAQTLVANYAKRLKEIEDAFVTRDEFLTVMKSKADNMMMPVKADSAVVVNLERRVFDKYAELEERVAYFEAEREEFRNVVRSLVALQQQHQVAAPPPPPPTTGEVDGAFPPISFSGRGPAAKAASRTAPAIAPVHLGEVLATSHSTGKLNASADPRALASKARQDSAASPAGVDVSGKTIYRVIGAERVAFATSSGRNPSSAADGGDAAAVGRDGGVVHRKGAESQQPRHSASGKVRLLETANTASSKDGAREYVGMTANQIAYAHLVSGELSRDDVKRLPVLPYETMS